MEQAEGGLKCTGRVLGNLQVTDKVPVSGSPTPFCDETGRPAGLR